MTINLIMVFEHTEPRGSKTIQVPVSITIHNVDPEKINEAIKSAFDKETSEHFGFKVTSISHTILPI